MASHDNRNLSQTQMGYEDYRSVGEAYEQDSPVSSRDVRELIENEGRSRRRRRRRIWTVVLVVSLIAFVGSITGLGVIGYSYLQGQQKYEGIANLVEVEALSDPIAKEAELSAIEESVKVDWDKLLAANSDTVAWLYVPGTVINYPVVRGEDNDFYLTHDFDGEAGWLANYGAIFMDYRNKPDWGDLSYFIYGHHMNDGTMFADLVGLSDQKRFDECRTLYVLSPEGNFKLKSFAMVHSAPEESIVYNSFKSQEEMVDYIEDKLSRSIVTVDDAPKAEDITKLFAFATCDNESWGRYILYAYVEDATGVDLEGKVGIKSKKGENVGFVEKLEQKSDKKQKSDKAQKSEKEQKSSKKQKSDKNK